MNPAIAATITGTESGLAIRPEDLRALRLGGTTDGDPANAASHRLDAFVVRQAVGETYVVGEQPDESDANHSNR